MKKIVPFKKEIIFKSNLSEINSISLEHSLHYESDNLITGEFIISGDYLMNDNSTNTEPFSFNIPFDINMDEKYILDKAVIDINDFYYEIINSKILSVNIEIAIDKLEEQPLLVPEKDEKFDILAEEEDRSEAIIESEEVEKTKEEVLNMEIENQNEELETERCVEEERVEVKSLFENITTEEEYSTYRICIVREGDSLENIMMKYSISREEMELYNDLKEIKIGDKLIIPSVKS